MEKVTVNVAGHGVYSLEKGETLLGLSKTIPDLAKEPIVASVNKELKDLCYQLKYDCEVEFLDTNDPNGFRAYQRSVSFLMIYAAKTVLGEKTRIVVAHSINKNYYCEIPELKEPITDELLEKIENVMREAVAKKLPFERHSLPLETAIKTSEALGFYDKVQLLKYRRVSSVNFYKLDWLFDYYYGQMAPDTGYLSTFKLVKRAGGFMLFFTGKVELVQQKRVAQVFVESSQWARILKVDTVGSLNDKISHDGSKEIVQLAEALHEKKIGYLADEVQQGGKTVVFIAGPSSSGKTTFASRLGVQLRVNGMRPHIISLDNYYIDREAIPLDEFGSPDFETINAIDTNQIDTDLRNLLKGEAVELPNYNFLTGKREYKGNILTIDKSDVLIIEGIHGLNERIGAYVPGEVKYKIFISALTQINIDDHNRIPTSDTRLLRRITRDFQYRGQTAERTIKMWPSVQRGEGKYIFPYQEKADAFFNSALVYEMCVLKQFAEPLLYGVSENNPERTEAKRLVKFLDSFLCISSEVVPRNSILREFIGGSWF